MADDVEAFIKELGLREPTLIGHSMFVTITALLRVTKTDPSGVPKPQ